MSDWKIGGLVELRTIHNEIVLLSTVTKLTPRMIVLADGSKWTRKGRRYGSGSTNHFRWCNSRLWPVE